MKPDLQTLPNRIDFGTPQTQRTPKMTFPLGSQLDAAASGTRLDQVRRAVALKRAAKLTVIVIGFLVLVLAITGLLSKDRIEIPPNHVGQYIEINGESFCFTQRHNRPTKGREHF